MTSWIKMGVQLRSHPKVVRLMSAMKADKLRILGGLFSVWCVFDAHSEAGALDGYTLDAMDSEIGWKGFSTALQSIGWLDASESGLIAPRFEEHNGATAKRRAMETSRKGQSRKSSAPNADKHLNNDPSDKWTEQGQMSASNADKLRNREEKRRKRSSPQPPSGGGERVEKVPPGFGRFWSAYPRKVGKDAAMRAFARRKPTPELVEAMVAAIAAQAASEQWQRDAKFVPHPTTWLNDGRWQDEAPGVNGEDIFSGSR